MTSETPERIVTIFGGAKCGELDPEYQQARRVGAASFAEKNCLKSQSAADGFFDNPHAFYGKITFRRRLTLTERFAQVFDERVLSAGNAAKAGIGFMYHHPDHNLPDST